MRPDDVVDFAFGRDLLSVTHVDGTQLHFTRQERALLARLTANPGRLLSRDVLVAAISAESTEPAGDRHVDFLVNQLRRKLRDDARAPRFIRTQYGEGYIWVGAAVAQPPQTSSLLRPGNIYGEHLPGATDLLARLTAALQLRLERAPAGDAATSSFTFDASFHDGGRRLQAALVLRNAATTAIIGTFRLATELGDDDAQLQATADGIVHAIWSNAALPHREASLAPGEPPPWVRLFEAALMMDGDQLTWKANAQRLEVMAAGEPDNAVMEVMRGLNLYTWLIQSFFDPSGQIVGEAQWRSVEDDIEAVALSNLPRFDGQPIMQLAVAKLLLFVNRGYLHLCRSIAEGLLSSTTAHATAFALAGEAAGFAGDFASAGEWMARALELSETRSPFQRYLLVVEASMLLGANDQPGFERVCRLTRDVSPDDAYLTVQAFCALPGYETNPLFRFVLAVNADRAGEALRFLWNVTGRRFVHRAHRRNFMRPMSEAMVQLFGVDVIPAEVDLGTGLRAELARTGQPEQ